MIKLNFKNPQDLCLFLISDLSPRSQDIIKKRYGITDNNPQTLEAIGRNYKVTRERIRQIIEVCLKNIKSSSKISEARMFWSRAKNLLEKIGGLEEEIDFLIAIQKELEMEKNNLSAIKFLLILNSEFILEPENNKTYSYWRLRSVSQSQIQNNVGKIEEFFKKRNKTAILNEIIIWIKNNIFPEATEKSVIILLKIIKSVGKNPFGEYGLKNWHSIEPAGAKDRAYFLISHYKKPLHFSEIAKSLNEKKETTESSLILSKSWFKKVEIQTVHNELIKDPRFILIGRGIYGLKDWGYKPGKITDVITDILKAANKPLTQEEIIKEVQKKRFVKANSIVLNLHNKQFFTKIDDDRAQRGRMGAKRIRRYALAGDHKILEV